MEGDQVFVNDVSRNLLEEMVRVESPKRLNALSSRTGTFNFYTSFHTLKNLEGPECSKLTVSFPVACAFALYVNKTYLGGEQIRVCICG